MFLAMISSTVWAGAKDAASKSNVVADTILKNARNINMRTIRLSLTEVEGFFWLSQSWAASKDQRPIVLGSKILVKIY